MATSPATAPEMAPRAVGFAVVLPLKNCPANGCGRGSKVRIHKGACGQRTCRKRAARVEPKPAHPQQACSDKAQHHGVGRHRGMWIPGALAQIKAGDECRNAAGNVDHGSACEIQALNVRAHRVKQAADAPDHVSHRAINQE